MQPRMKHVSRADTTKYLPWRHAEVLSSQLSLALGDELLKLNGGENQENLRPENAVYTTLYNIITEGYALDATQDEINHAIMACAALAIDQLAIISKIHTQGLRDIVRKR